MVVWRDVVLLRERLDLQCLRVIENAVTAEAGEAVVVLEDDHEDVVEPRDTVLVTLVILGARRRNTHCERHSDRKSQQIFFHPSILSCLVARAPVSYDGVMIGRYQQYEESVKRFTR